MSRLVLAARTEHSRAAAPSLATPTDKSGGLRSLRIPVRERIDASDYDMAVAEQFVASVVPAAKVGVRTSAAGLSAVLEDGRFRTQHETGTCGPGGFLSPRLRERVEKEVFGYDPKRTPAEARPVYGHLFSDAQASLAYRGDSRTGSLNRYGDILVEFRPEVAERTTWCLGDSIDDSGWGAALDNGGRQRRLTEHQKFANRRNEQRGAAPRFSTGASPNRCPTPITAPGVESLGTWRPTWSAEHDPDGGTQLDKGAWGYGDGQNGGRPKPYYEAQVHGGVDASDIAHVHALRLPQALKDRLDEVGVPWTEHGR